MRTPAATRFQRRPRARQFKHDAPESAFREVSEGFREVREHLDEITKSEIVDGRFIDEATHATSEGRGYVNLTPGEVTKIKHGLGRKLRGWQVADVIADGATAAGSVLRVTVDGSLTADEHEDLWLKPVGFTGATTVKARLWVY